MEIGSMLMQLAGGLGLFLFGMKLMGDGLEMAAGSKLRGMIERLTKTSIWAHWLAWWLRLSFKAPLPPR